MTRALKIIDKEAPDLDVSMVTIDRYLNKKNRSSLISRSNDTRPGGRDNSLFTKHNEGEDDDWLEVMGIIQSELKRVYGLDFDIHHLVPVSKGGSFHISNLRLIPTKVNSWVRTDDYTSEDIDQLITNNSNDRHWQGYSWARCLPIQEFLQLFAKIAPTLPKVVS